MDTICVGCDLPASVNDLGLCSACYDKLERDLIRSRDWNYSAMAFMTPDAECEELRLRVISEYGAAYELIEPPHKSDRRAPKQHKTELQEGQSPVQASQRPAGTYKEQEVIEALEKILASTSHYVWRELAEVATLLRGQFLGFNPKDFGHKNLLRLIQSYPKHFHTRWDDPKHKRNARVFVRLSRDHTLKDRDG